MHNVFYLKYRPQTLNELVGQETVKKNLLSSFQNSKLSHAYLFVGPRGTGKTSTARILAKMVNCEKGITSDTGTISTTGDSPRDTRDTSKTRGTQLPCNECSACLSITDGSNLDLIEIDAASNRGIEDIRSLRDKIKLAPTSAKKKVYIIDEAHMLTTEAFNALLKTLEEPPKHALFILATTEGSKVPQTILSRVQRLDFNLAKPAELSEAMSKIAKSEKIDIDQEALKILVRQAGGSFRDGVKLLDQVSSLGEKITAKVLEENLKAGQFDDILNLLQSLAAKDSKESLLKIFQTTEQGTDVKELMLSLMEIIRSLVFIKNGLGKELVEPQFTEDKYEQMVKLSGSQTHQDLVKDLNILQEALEKLKFASIQSLPLELAVVEICGSEEVSRGERVSPRFAKALREGEQVSRGEEKIPEEKPRDTRDTSKTRDTFEISPDIQKLKEKWTFVLETIRPFNFSLEALLRSIKIAQCTQESVIMEVPYSFHQRILEAPKNRDLLESILSDILGRNMKISIVLGSRPVIKEDIANIEMAQDDEIIRAAAEIFNSDTVN